jgi:hypothetical protein
MIDNVRFLGGIKLLGGALVFAAILGYFMHNGLPAGSTPFKMGFRHARGGAGVLGDDGRRRAICVTLRRLQSRGLFTAPAPFFITCV